MTNTELWVSKTEFRKTKVVKNPLPVIGDGEILVSIDKFALTSNNVGYAISGDMIGYWNYFPTSEDGWGKITVWGMADVIASNNADIKVGERLYGFYPMSSYLVLQPDKVQPQSFTDSTEHRKKLPALYNQYMRCQAEPAFLQSMENERCIYFPLFMTGFVIADFLMDNDWFGVDQVIVGSASSKTGIGTASFVRANGFEGKIIGLTSPSNVAFVKDLSICDQVVTYGDTTTLDTCPSVYIDMAGNGSVRSDLHHHLGENIKSDQIVGATHWDCNRSKEKLPGARPAFFFTPAQIDKRNQDWGPGVLMQKGYEAAAKLILHLKGQMRIEHHQGPEALTNLWRDMLDNKVSGQRGLILSLKE